MNVLYQLVVVWQASGEATKALRYGDELLALRGKQCTEEDFDGFCGRYNGIKMMIAMEQENAQPPPEEDQPKPKVGQVDVFEEGGDEDLAVEGEEESVDSGNGSNESNDEGTGQVDETNSEAKGNTGSGKARTATSAASSSS